MNICTSLLLQPPSPPDQSISLPNTSKRVSEEPLDENVVEPNLNIEPRKSKRQRIERSFGPDFLTYLVEGDVNNITHQTKLNLSDDSDPATYAEAISSRDAAFWKEAINDEMNSIMSNQTWKLVDLPYGSKPIGCKWIFKRKLNADGSINKYKARLVAKGFKQRHVIDYFDTFAPVARISSICVLLSLASIYKLVVHQMDVKIAFLNGDLEEEVYMEQTEGFVLPGQEKKVCKLINSLYGLKQAPMQ